MEISTLVARFSETHIQPKVRAIAPQNQRIALIAGAIFLTILFLAASACIWRRREVKKVDSNSKPDLTPLPTDKKTDNDSPNALSSKIQNVVSNLEKILRSSGVAAEIYSKAFEDYVNLFIKYSDDLKVELKELKANAKGGDALSMQLLTALNDKTSLLDYQKIKASFDAFTKEHPPIKASSESFDKAAGTGLSPTLTVDIPAPGFLESNLEPAPLIPAITSETLQEWVNKIAGNDHKAASEAMVCLFRYKQANHGCVISGYDVAYEVYKANRKERKKALSQMV